MSTYKIDEIDFRPRVPGVRLVLSCLAFGVLGWAFSNETIFKFQIVGQLTLSYLVEVIGISLLILGGFCFVTSFLLLQFRLRFTETGIRRFTLLGPRFIPWGSVRAAQLESFKGYLMLSLWVSRWRWIYVPLMEFRSSARLFEEIRKKLPVEVRVTENQRALLRDP